MPYLAKDRNEDEWLFDVMPERKAFIWDLRNRSGKAMNLPKGAIKALIGYDLKWEDEPVELTEELLKRD